MIDRIISREEFYERLTSKGYVALRDLDEAVGKTIKKVDFDGCFLFDISIMFEDNSYYLANAGENYIDGGDSIRYTLENAIIFGVITQEEIDNFNLEEGIRVSRAAEAEKEREYTEYLRLKSIYEGKD